MQPGLGPVNTRNLVAYCGSVEEVFRQKQKLLVKIPGIGPQTALSLAKLDTFQRAETELKFIKNHEIEALFFTDEKFPQRLHHCADAPVLLYYKGSVSLNNPRMVAIVGTRSATEYGKVFTEQLIADLKSADVTIVSGLAFGIDIKAHRSAMHCAIPTLGVVAHGLDRIYPAQHSHFAARMTANGGLLTEYPSDTIPDRENFPSRNRIVAGICDVVVVVEAAGKGGALITADIANSYNRDVFAVPGRVGDEFSVGCNAFIRQNRAALLTSAKDLLDAMSWETSQVAPDKPAIQRQLFVQLGPDEEKICGVLKAGKMDADNLAWQAGMPVSQVNSVLLKLELKGVLRAMPGRIYQLV